MPKYLPYVTNEYKNKSIKKIISVLFSHLIKFIVSFKKYKKI